MNQLIIDLFQAVDCLDLKRMSEIFHNSMVYERPAYPRLVGVNRILEFYEHERVISSGQHHIEHIVVSGDHAACWGRFVGVKRDGSHVDEGFADVYAFQDGRIIERRTYFYRPAV